VGRQPWIVYPSMVDGRLVAGLRTAAAVSENISSNEVIGSIVMFGIMYTLLFVLWVFVLNHKIQHGPEPIGAEPETTSAADYLGAASRRVAHEDSLTEPKDAPAR
jgi:cytochrome d ubiquinol oxidase subunit I